MNTIAVLLISVIGSTHCAAMCGGFATVCGQHGSKSWFENLSYNAGRLTVYLILGALAGLIGSSIDILGLLGGVTQLSATILGIFFIIFGLADIAEDNLPRIRSVGKKIHSRLFSTYLNTAGEVSRLTSKCKSLVVGMLSALLPCGWLYSFVAAAGATGSVESATLTMFIFWLGTLPIMLSIGSVSQYLAKRWGIERSRVTAALLIVAGLLAIAGHLGNPLLTSSKGENILNCH